NIVEGKESRIGKQPIEVPSNVVITLEGQDMKVEGTLGELAVSYSHKMMIDMQDAVLRVCKAVET
ncbi:50S ribosomal protein L6, chloroplastic, partial [Tanacetum coccineum]